MSTKTQQLKSIIESFDNAMLTTLAADGTLHSRPMRVAETTDGCDIFFVTSIDTAKTQEISGNAQVNVSMQGGSRFVSLLGIAKVIDDRAKIDQLWSEAWKLWFPEGKTSPDLRLIHVDATAGEFWDMSGTKAIKYMLNASKAYFAGQQVEVDESMNAKVQL